MKIRPILLIVLFFSTFVYSQNYHDTQGSLEISDTGQSIYTLPVAMPPSIQSVGPTINLVYASGQQGGVAGQGWNISGLSSITRVSTRKDVDGTIDGVDFDSNDKLALDGQRLILKSGTYWGDGSTYETEIQSNTKIELFGSGSSTMFIVTTPDGSKTWYGTSGTGSGVVGNELDSFFYIKKFQDINGNIIEYKYVSYGIAGTYPKLYIDEILFSANTVTNPSYLNKIKFNYELATRYESVFIKGIKLEKSFILKSIEVYTNITTTNNLFRRYLISHTTDEIGYQRINSITEYNGAGEAANPVNFEYHSTPVSSITTFEDGLQAYIINPDGKTIGDPDGDGKPNFVYMNKITKSSGVPIDLPFFADLRRTHFVRTLQDNKLTEKPKLLNIVENTNSLELKLYNVENINLPNPLINNYSSKVVPFDNTTTYDPSLNTISYDGSSCSNCESDCGPVTTKYNEYIHGDFNGDGISEMLIFSRINEKYYFETKTYSFSSPVCKRKYTGDGFNVYVADLNPNAPAIEGTEGFVKIQNLNYLQVVCKKYVQDFNGDGKDDVLIINQDNSYKVISFTQLTSSPWITSEIIGQGIFYFNFFDEKVLLFGDYNGDGKADMMHPNVVEDGCEDEWYCDIWYTYYSNPKLNAGDFFEIVSQSITDYMPVRNYNTQAFYNRYMAMDVNKDGITDLVRIELRTYEHTNFWDWNHLDNGRNSFRIHTFVKMPGGFFNDYTSSFYEDGTVNGNVAIPVNVSYNRNFITQDLVLFRKGNEVNGTDTTFYIKFTKDFTSDNSLKKVTQSGGSIIDEIEYKNLGGNYGDNSFYVRNYSSTYPYIDIKEVPNTKLVSKIKNTVNGTITRFRDFAYYGYTLKLDGIGSVGFIRTAKTNWQHNYYNTKIWNVSENDVTLRGVNIKSWSTKYDTGQNFNISSSFAVTTGTISSVINNFYAPVTDPISKKYTLLLQTQTSTNYLSGVKSEKTYTYSNEGYNLPSTIVYKNYQGTVLQGTTTTVTDFESNVIGSGGENYIGSGSDYYIGRPKEIIKTVEAYGDVKSESEKLNYQNGNIHSKEKKVGTTPTSLINAVQKIVETFAYFPNGNLQSKTLSAYGFPATTPPLSSRITSYTYDPTNRFIKTTTDADGILTTNNTYNNYGQVLSQTNNTLSQSSSSIYDNWGKKTKFTDFLGKYIDYVYTRSNNVYRTTQNGSDLSSSFVESDALARIIRVGKKNINNIWSYQSTEYDALGRKTNESEPYFSNQTPIWSTTYYDEYDRPISTISKGKYTTITYDGLNATSTDGLLTKITTKNSNGHLVSIYESQGGLINYTYDALGNVLTTNYDGIVTSTIDYDLWGRRMSLDDVSTGPYTYVYNAYGEILKETSPIGFTEYTYTPSGKLLTKWVKDAPTPINTNIKSTYTYHSTYKWLTNITVLNPIDGNSSYTYTYDVGTAAGYTNTKQLKKIDEITPQATFSKEYTFDSFGRVLTEKLTATAHGKTAIKTTNNSYVNGELYQKFDGTTPTGTPIWKANTVNARGSLTSLSFGNGINVTNTFHNYGYLTSSVHSNTQTSIVLNNTFDTDATYSGGDPIFGLGGTYTSATGNLLNKNYSITSGVDSFIQDEDYGYDNLDRLVSWNTGYELIHDITFTNSVEGFVPASEPFMILAGSATQILEGGALKVSTNGTAGTKKLIYQNAVQGKSFKVQAQISLDNYNYTCNPIGLGSPPSISLFVIEVDPSTQNVLHSQAIALDSLYTVTQDSDVYIGFYNQMSFFCTGTATFFIDNIKVFEQKAASQSYDNRGRITQNDLGSYNYTKTAQPYQNTSVTLTGEGITYYEARARLSVSYNAFKAPIAITETNIERLNFGYNAMQQRSVMYYGNYVTDKLQRPYRKYYSSDGSMEIKYTLANGTVPEKVEFFTYIGGDAYTAPIVSRQENTASPSYFYLHRDYQGSILAITNSTGVVVEKRQFDVWGNVVKVEDAAGNLLPKLTFFDRGYTGHEHLQTIALINMNARLYDPVIHRFLQADNFIADSSNGQNYNRYSYCLNNPTKYVDTDGNNPILIGIGIALATYFVSSAINQQNITFAGIFKTVIIGYMTSVASFGIGEAVETIKPLLLKATVQAVAHGTTQGGIGSIMQGGKFWNGFASGSISSIASSGFGALPSNISRSGVGTIAFGTISGGAGAALTGGNFWEGAVTGLVVSGLNHYNHMDAIRDYIDSRLEFAGYDRDDIIDMNDEALDLFTRKVFPELYEEGGCPEMLVNDLLKPYGETRRFGGENGISVHIAPKAFKTNFRLGAVVGHELIHAGDIYSGRFSYWESYGGEDYAVNMSEYNAYNWNLYTNSLFGNYTTYCKHAHYLCYDPMPLTVYVGN